MSSDPASQDRRDGLATRPSAKEDWRYAAACRSTDPDLFFPISATGRALEQVSQAKEICAGCPVTRECLSFALRTHQIHGIWGGMTEEERHLRSGPTSRSHPPVHGASPHPRVEIQSGLQPDGRYTSR